LEESEILDVLKTNEFDPRQFVVIEETPGVPHPEEGFVLVEAKIAEYSANKITCIAESSYPGFLVLTDNPYFNVGKIISIIAFVLSVGLCILAIRVKI
jgi:hypothetical protein